MKSLSVERGFGRVRLRRVRWLHEMAETSKSTSQTLVVRFAPWRRGVLSSVGCRSLGRVWTLLARLVSLSLGHSFTRLTRSLSSQISVGPWFVSFVDCGAVEKERTVPQGQVLRPANGAAVAVVAGQERLSAVRARVHH